MVEPDLRDAVVDFIKDWGKKADLPVTTFLIGPSLHEMSSLMLLVRGGKCSAITSLAI